MYIYWYFMLLPVVFCWTSVTLCNTLPYLIISYTLACGIALLPISTSFWLYSDAQWSLDCSNPRFMLSGRFQDLDLPKVHDTHGSVQTNGQEWPRSWTLKSSLMGCRGKRLLTAVFFLTSYLNCCVLLLCTAEQLSCSTLEVVVFQWMKCFGPLGMKDTVEIKVAIVTFTFCIMNSSWGK